MNKQEKQNKLYALWEQLFVLQREAAKGELCFPDKCQYSDLSEQIKKLSQELKNS